MNRKVLLIEPNYKNKFPPIGLMKLATYFRLCKDDVYFFKGDLRLFMLDFLTEECLKKLATIDNSINWRIRANHIKEFIRTGKQQHLDAINIDDSQFALFVYPLIDQYKKEYKTGAYKNNPRFDWVGVTTLFTFYWDITIETIEFAKKLVKDPAHNLMVGGVLASIQPKEIFEATGIEPFRGTLHTAGDIDKDNNYIIDELPLDYSILNEIDYIYPDNNAYFSYTTRGCIRHCAFCAVPTLEPQYIDRIPLKARIDRTRKLYGEQRNLLLMDNNILASKKLERILKDIKESGFSKDDKYFESNQYEISIKNLKYNINNRAYIRKCFKLLKELNENNRLPQCEQEKIYAWREEYGLLYIETCTREALIKSYKYFAPYFEEKYSRQQGRRRIVDFNQGVDARLFTEDIVSLLADIPIRPLRIAFDNIKTKDSYLNAVEMSIRHGIKDFSNYLLYNFTDKPEDLYERLRINVDLCDKYSDLGVSIYSFPMKYHPITGEYSHNRNYIGKYWNRKYIRAVQAILNATKGKVGKGTTFFEKAFGRDLTEYMKLLIMPETFLLYRLFFEHIGYTQQWWHDMQELSEQEKNELYPIIFENKFNNIEELTDNLKYRRILNYYKNYRDDIINPDTELYRLKQEFDKLDKLF